jgi:Fe-Mn family superoxide dismutase
MMSGLRALAAAALIAVAAAPGAALAQFALPPLPYAANALEPHIDTMTMEIHHGRHHMAFITALNAQARDNPALKPDAVEAVLREISKHPVPTRNALGGHYNHDLFWQVMAPANATGAPSAALTAAINAAFGSMDEMKKRFDQAAVTRFGSGWAWLIVTADRKLAITSTANQDNPLMDIPGIERGTPVLGLDVWEHAYYLKYQNRRADYVTTWWNVVNWNEVSRRFDAATR